MARRSMIAIATLAAVAGAASAQYPSDPALNLAVADGPTPQNFHGIAATADGGCYVAWFDAGTGSFVLRLQRLDASGAKQWGDDGILVSDHPQDGHAIFGFDMIADSSGQCVLALSDLRDGNDLDVHAYRVAPDGSFTWGRDGVTLSSNDDFEPAPVVTEAASGDFVFVWARSPAVGDGALLMQRLSPAGAPLLAAGGVAIAGAPGEKPGFPRLVPGAADGVIVAWVRDLGGVDALRHIRVAACTDTGSLSWGPVTVYDAAPIPVSHAPSMVPDGAGGAVLCWHDEVDGVHRVFAQRVDAAGDELFAHNGVRVSTDDATHHRDPTLAWLGATQEIVVFWNQRNTAQTQWGINAQKLSATGAAQWGGAGATVLPLDGIVKSRQRAIAAGDGATVFLFDEPDGDGLDRVVGARMASDGTPVWSPSPRVFASTLSVKSNLDVAAAPDGTALLGWQDSRDGSTDAYAQNANSDGSLGPLDEPADVTGDGVVDVQDLVEIILAWGPCAAPCIADVNDDGVVDVVDLVAVILAWS